MIILHIIPNVKLCILIFFFFYKSISSLRKTYSFILMLEMKKTDFKLIERFYKARKIKVAILKIVTYLF